MESLKGCIIAYKSLGVGSFDYSFKLDNDFFNLFEGSEITAGNCGVEVQLRRGETMLEIFVKIEGEVTVACDRCLEDCAVAINYDGKLIVKFSSEVNDYDGEILWLSPCESQVDLNQYIYESIVLSLPYQRVHAEGGCNEEMIRKFAIISGEELEQLEQSAQSDEEMAESHGLEADDIAKLQALKELMSKEEE